MNLATVTSKGQITIPSVVRRKLDIKKGDKVAIEVTEEGKATLDPLKFVALDTLMGSLKTSRRRGRKDERTAAKAAAVKRHASRTL